MISRVRIHATTPEGVPPLDLTAPLALEMERTRRRFRAEGKCVGPAFYDNEKHGLCFLADGDGTRTAFERPRLYRRRR